MLREEHRLRAFEEGALREILELRRARKEDDGKKKTA
jgi:hypothetical protein